TLAAANMDKVVRLWDLASLSQRASIGGPDLASKIVYASDDQTLAVGYIDSNIRLLDAPTGAQRRLLRQHDGPVFSLSWSPDGRVLAPAGHDRTVKVWARDRSDEPRILRGHTGQVLALAYAPDGQTLASGGNDGKVFVWDPATGKPRYDRQDGNAVYSL